MSKQLQWLPKATPGSPVRPGVLNVTTGPGGINALNGVFGAWTDSIPMLILSGQVKRETCMATYGLTDLRQLGDQEVDIVRMVKGITKYSVFVANRNRSPIIWSVHGTLRRTGVRAHAGSIYQLTCNRHRSNPDSFAIMIPQEDAVEFDRATMTVSGQPMFWHASARPNVRSSLPAAVFGSAGALRNSNR